jgi:hypothetical protein
MNNLNALLPSRLQYRQTTPVHRSVNHDAVINRRRATSLARSFFECSNCDVLVRTRRQRHVRTTHPHARRMQSHCVTARTTR